VKVLMMRASTGINFCVLSAPLTLTESSDEYVGGEKNPLSARILTPSGKTYTKKVKKTITPSVIIQTDETK
jgi:hypothetical protein